MKTLISKKAAAIIAAFTPKEKAIYNSGISFLTDDMEHIVKCDKEITVYENPNPEKYRTAIRHQTNMSFRAKYLLQCLDLFINENYETMAIEIKSINDK